MKLLCAILLVLSATLLLAACGGSSSTGSDSAPSSQSVPAAGLDHSAAKRASHSTATTRANPDTVTNGVVTHRPAPGTGGGEINDDNPGRADSGSGTTSGRLNPCALVSKAQAQAIIGRAIAAPVEAPLGPTCIYRTQDAKSMVTLTVELLDFSKVKSQMRNRTQLAIGGHTAYCGDYGQQVTYVPLAGGRVLNVTASCTVGARFAAKALNRIPG